MFPQTLYPKTTQVLTRLSQANILQQWYLAGGTALAIQLGHRKSIDLDFFIPSFPKRDLLLAALKPFSPQIIQEAAGTLDTIIDTVKVSFLEYSYPQLEEGPLFESVRLASIIDIACMKLSAVSSRGAKKDFIDLYQILKTIPLNELLIRFSVKFAGVTYNDLHIIKSLSYIDDAERDPNPDMIETYTWSDVKQYFEKLAVEFMPT